MRRLVFFAVAAAVAVCGTAVVAEAGRLPKAASNISRQKSDDHHPMASIHGSRGPRAPRKIEKDIPADEARDNRRTHGIREQPPAQQD
jgi:hypothetical protein